MSRIKTKKLTRKSPKWAVEWANSLLEDVIRTHIVTVLNGGLNETPDGTGITVGGGADGEPLTYYVVINGQLYTQEFLTASPPVAV